MRSPAVWVLFILSLVPAAEGQLYKAVPILHPSGSPFEMVGSLNNLGEVAVTWSASNPNWIYSYIWRVDSLTLLPQPDATNRTGVARLNDVGQALGFYYWSTDGSGLRAWSNGIPQVLTFPPYFTYAYPGAMNNSGAFITTGYVLEYSLGAPVQIYSTLVANINGSVQTVSGGWAYGINDRGWLAGSIPGSNGTLLPTLWRAYDQPVALGDFGVANDGGEALDINYNGEAVGYLYKAGHLDDSATTAFRSLGTIGSMVALPDTGTSRATGINSAAKIVGWTRVPGYNPEAAIWVDRQLLKLQSLLVNPQNITLRSASEINDRDEILASSDTTYYLLVPQNAVSVRFDRNRNGIISYDTSDDAENNVPYRFWVDNDRDAFDSNANEEDDMEPLGVLDNDVSIRRVTTKRELEDYIPCEIRAPAQMSSSSSWRVKLSFAHVSSGAPSIRIFRAVAKGSAYLTNSTTGDAQLAVTDCLILDANSTVDIPFSWFQLSSGPAAYTAPLLIAGLAPGSGDLHAEALEAGTLVGEDFGKIDFLDIKSMYDHFTVGDTATADPLTIPSAATKIQSATLPDTNNDYLLFVHGWRLQPWERRAFAETALKRMWHQGYRGNFGLFSWPTEWNSGKWWTNALFDSQNYDRSENKAWRSSAGLQGVLQQLHNSQFRVHLVAHSMGNVVASDALLRSLAGTVATYIPTQAATVGHAYDSTLASRKGQKWDTPNVYAICPPTNLPYFSGFGAAAGRTINFYNTVDAALGTGWEYNQNFKPDTSSSYNYISTTNRFYFVLSGGGTRTLVFPADRGEIYGFCAEGRSAALGRSATVSGLFSVNLQAAPFLFTSDDRDHSGQFRSYLTRRREYWRRLMTECGIPTN